MANPGLPNRRRASPRARWSPLLRARRCECEALDGVAHHVELTIVGADRVPDSGYMRAKLAQENLIEEAGQPYTIVRSTQFMEFLRALADAATDGDTVRVPDANLQPIAAADVAAAVTDAALSDPINGIIEIAGPEKIKGPELIRRVLAADNDPRLVVGDPHAIYFGTELTTNQSPPARTRTWARRPSPSGSSSTTSSGPMTIVTKLATHGRALLQRDRGPLIEPRSTKAYGADEWQDDRAVGRPGWYY